MARNPGTLPSFLNGNGSYCNQVHNPWTPPATNDPTDATRGTQLPPIHDLGGARENQTFHQLNHQGFAFPAFTPPSPISHPTRQQFTATALPPIPRIASRNYLGPSLQQTNRQRPLPPLDGLSALNFPAILPHDGAASTWNRYNPSPLSTPQREPASDDYLQLLLNGDFSSPSLPTQSPPPSALIPGPSVTHLSPTAPPPPPLVPDDRPPVIRPSFWQGAKREKNSERDEEDSSAMPTLRKRPASSSARSEGEPPAKRPRIGTRGRPAPPLKRAAQPTGEADVDHDIFGSSDHEDGSAKEDTAVVDLSNLGDDDVVEPESKPDTSIKLSAFQCVICMDDVTNLTVTHCGHLFCSECLHSSLNIDATKKICPICRQKINTRTASNSQARTANSYFHLEVKMITRNRLGKKPAKS